ncbi:hypothetical protein Agub_g8006 [Astrephomene gubernaculifera]|uniref:Glutathione S-transferase family protein n=1 Tax=Astrephomene gubernaculifera TaxID=47775 RepID=A0AAD3HMQ4_9CHLO|nr:hypothetical protein Agub_g8006 [Astrephomene gubernaculifera]
MLASRPVASNAACSNRRTKSRSLTMNAQASGAHGATRTGRMVLYDVPLSNNGARNRYIIRKKGLENEIDIVSPQTIGGLKSPEYLALNPQGKMPLLVLEDGTAIPESEVISQYLLDRFADRGPSLRAATPEARARAALATRLHDLYICSVQAAMYRRMERPEERAAQIGQIAFQLGVLEGVVQGPYIAGADPTSADAALFPTFVFLTFMLPRYFGWRDVFAGKPRLAAWWRTMQADPAAAQIMLEIEGGLEGWAASNRWQEQGILDQVANTSFKWAY